MAEPQSGPGDVSDILRALETIHLFRGLTTAGLDRIAAIASEESPALASHVFREGEAGDKLYLILEGKIRISRTLPGMGEEAIAVLGPGEAFGEMSLIEDVPRSADAIVHDKCRLLTITRDAFEDLLFINKELAYEILWNFVKILSQRLRDTNDKMAFMTVSSQF